MTRKPLSPWHTLALNNALFAAALHDICCSATLRTRSAESETGSFTGAWGPEDEEPDPPMVLLGVC